MSLLVKGLLSYEEDVVLSVLLSPAVESLVVVCPICTINIYGPSRQVLIRAFIACKKKKHLHINGVQSRRQEKDRSRLAIYGWYLPCKYKFCLFQDLKFVSKYLICKF